MKTIRPYDKKEKMGQRIAALILILVGSIRGLALTQYVEVDKDTGMEIVYGSYGWHIVATVLCAITFVALLVISILHSMDGDSDEWLRVILTLLSSLFLVLSATILIMFHTSVGIES